MKSTLFILLGFLFVFSSCGDTNTTSPEASSPATTETQAPAIESNKGQAYVSTEGSDPNALQLAASMEDFSTLAAAVKAGGVENALVNAGPLTVFAPLNTAFAKLPEGTVETLLKPENKGQLAYILTNHVAPSNYGPKQLIKEVKKGRKLYMASGKYLEVIMEGDDIFVGGTKVLKSVKVSNGWVHVIDDVLVPAE